MLVLTQYANLRIQGKWLFTKYDQFSRPIYTGILDSPPGRIQQVNAIEALGSNNEVRSSYSWNNSGMDVYYTNNTAYPTTNFKLLSVNYYDTYPSYSFNPAFPADIQGAALLTEVPSNDARSTKGLPVMSLVKNIEDDNWTKNYSYYDTKGRAVGGYSINHLGGYTRPESQLDFAGVPLKSVTRHKRLDTDTEKVITENFEYDQQNRLKKHYHQVDSQPQELLTENSYNELSQLKNKKVGNNLQSIDYAYNIRGWMTKINDPATLNGKLFGYEIKYDYPIDIEKRYNGNITEVDWRTASDNVFRRYDYRYDGLNRLTLAHYREPLSTVSYNNFYNEEAAYDLNGNITRLWRNRNATNIGAELIDNLSYSYIGNRLNSVTDSSGNYFGYPDVSGNPIAYDNNGNMIDHVDKDILQIDYNYLNMPNYIKFNRFVTGRFGVSYENTNYTYRSDGIKLNKKYNYFSGRNQNSTVVVTDYLDGFQYKAEITLVFSESPMILQFAPTSEGYYDFVKNKYIYQYKDQVGNIRLAFYKDALGNPVIDRANDFYPFGLEFGGGGMDIYNSISPNYMYNFQGQEKQADSGWNSYKWRNYDPTMGRFFNIDPLSEKYAYQSHYNFSENKVINARELEGLEAVLINENTIEWRVKVDNKLGRDYSKTLLQDAAGALSQNGLTVNIIEDPKAKFTIELAQPVSKFTDDGIVTTNGYTVNDGNIYDGTAVSKDSPRTLAHELGHKASLPHIFSETSKVENIKENQKNLMNSDDNNKVELRDTAGTNLTTSQTTDIKNHIKITNDNRERKEKEQQKLNQAPSQNEN